MVEFVIVVVPLLLLILGAIQFGLIYNAKITLNYAAFETARAGSLTGARMIFMENAFARALAPLYTNSWRGSMDECANQYPLDRYLDETASDVPPDGQSTELTHEHFECAREHVRDMINPPAGERAWVRIVRVNPAPESFMDYGVQAPQVIDLDPAADSALNSVLVIPNDNLVYRSSAEGANSGQSIQDANLLKVHVSFCYELVVPFVRQVMRQIMAPQGGDTGIGIVRDATPFDGPGVIVGGDGFRLECAQNGGIALYAQSMMRMQFPAVQELNDCVGWCATP